LFIITNISFSQTPCQDCLNAGYEYPYLYCDKTNDRLFWQCNTEPYTIDLSRYKPYRLCLPSSFIYDDSGLRNGIWFYDTLHPHERSVIVFDESKVYDIIDEQFEKWTTDICIPLASSDCYSCQVKIVWANDAALNAADPNAINYPAFARRKILGPAGGGVCELDCSIFQIMLNTSDYWTKVADWTIPTEPERFFYTNDLEPGHPVEYDKWLDLRVIILHELGHIFGFEHTITGQGAGIDCGNSNSIMSDNKSNHTRNLTDYDKCMFRLLYCCPNITDVSLEEQSNLIIDVIPNPAYTEVTVKLFLDYPIDSQIYLFNSVGQLLDFQGNKYGSNIGNHLEYNFNINELANGQYTLILHVNNQIIHKSFIVNK